MQPYEDQEDERDEDDPNDPLHPDHDLSESMPYSSYVAPEKPWYTRRWLLLIVALLVVAGMLLPYLRNLL